MLPHATLRSPAEVLAAVPYLVGFHPAHSLVLLAFHGKRVIFQARVDLPPADSADDVGEYLAGVAARSHPAGVILIAYGLEADAMPVIESVGVRLARYGIAVMSVLRVQEGRYWELLCDDPVCNPPEGVPFDIATTEVAAAATFAGAVVHPDRRALAETVEPVAGAGIEPEIAAALDRLEALPGGQRQQKTAARAAVRRALERYLTGGRLDDDEVAWLAVLLADVTVRDDIWVRIVAGPSMPEHREAWRDIVRRVPQRYVPAPATLLALVAWRAGEGALAGIAAERALAADRGYRLASLLLHAMRQGLPPSALDDMPERRRRRRRAPRLTEAA
jgi:hypothetical protein